MAITREDIKNINSNPDMLPKYEASIIASVLFTDEGWKYALYLQPSMFTVPLHQAIVSTIKRSVTNGASRLATLDEVKTKYYGQLDEIYAAEPIAKSQWFDIAEEIGRFAKKENLKRTLERALEELKYGSSETYTLQKLNSELTLMLSQYEQESTVKARDYVREYIKRLKLAGKESNVYETPWQPLNILYAGTPDIEGGLDKGMLHVLAGDTGHGKTALALNIGVHVAKTHPETDVFFVSAEMPWPLLMSRIATMLAPDVHKMYYIKKNNLTDAELEDIATVLEKKMPENIYFIGSESQFDFSVSAIISKIAAHRAKTQRQVLLIVDYLQLLAIDERAENEAVRISKITRSFVRATNQYNFTALLLSQMSRAPQDAAKDYDDLAHRLKGSSAIEQDAASIVFIHMHKSRDESLDEEYVIRDPRTNAKRYRLVSLILAKNRAGTKGDIKMWFDMWTMRFYTEGELIRQGLKKLIKTNEE